MVDVRQPIVLRSFNSAYAEESQHPLGGLVKLHRHDAAFAAIVLDGAYDEVSTDAVVFAARGNVVVHPPFHAHRNAFKISAAVVLNVVLPAREATTLGYRIFYSAGTEELSALARRDSRMAAMSVIEEAAAARPPMTSQDWLETAAAQLRANPAIRAGEAAQSTGRTIEHFSRAFTTRYGVGPSVFRAEYRFRRALIALLGGARPVEAAAAAGYSDQSHLTRECRRITGKPPAMLAREIKSVQDDIAASC